MIRKLVDFNDPVLSTPANNYEFTTPEESIRYAREIVENMAYYAGIGLAAPQLGDPYNVFCVASNPVIVCFNPNILDFSEECVTLEEGCLSYPGLLVKVRRPKHIRIRFFRPNGEVVTESYTGVTARVMQHEMEHLHGIKFFDNVDWYEKEKVKRWMKKRKKI